jgi:hypothetical protein
VGFGRIISRKAGPIGIALTTYDIWRRLPPEYRRQIIAVTRKHGPKVAALAAKRFSEYRQARKYRL